MEKDDEKKASFGNLPWNIAVEYSFDPAAWFASNQFGMAPL
jgi:hypothetical protein